MIQQVVTVTTAMMASKDRSAEEYMRDKLNALRAFEKYQTGLQRHWWSPG
jgi:hypothetical protein